MCGICGIISYKQSKLVSKHHIEKMVSTLHHRGPDYHNSWLNHSVAFGHTRLSILDLSVNGNQPMYSYDKRYIIVLNGEIYNYKEIRNKLRKLNIPFSGSSDTEVLVNAFAVWGEEIFPKLNGIYALAIYNIQKEEVILARDRFGVKPLYYQKSDNGFLFGSEIKAILEISDIKRKINLQAFHEFSYFGNSLQENTMFSGIHRLKAGFTLKINKKGMKLSKYLDINPEIRTDILENNAVVKVRNLLEDSVKRQLVSDVPVGIFLSGGIDSSAVTAFASKYYNGQIKTFTANFEFMPESNNELLKARKTAEYYNTDHYEMNISCNDLPEVIESLIFHHDEPFSDAANIPLYLMSKEIAGEIKVILQGDGGDELFAGYRRYSLINNYKLMKILASITPINLLSMFSNSSSDRIKRIHDIFSSSEWGTSMGKLLTTDTNQNSFYNLLSDDFKNTISTTDPYLEYNKLAQYFSKYEKVNQMLFTDLKLILTNTFLEKVDKSTMAMGIESRVPFLDNHLTDYVLSLPSSLKVHGKEKKYILKKALRGIVPNFVLDSPKMGFGVPYAEWLRGPLKGYLKDALFESNLQNIGIIDMTLLKMKYDKFQQTPNQHDAYILWKAMNFSIWVSKYKVSL